MRVSHVALDGCEVLPHGVDVVPVPLVLVVGGELQHADDLVNLLAHPTGEVVAVLGGLIHAATSYRRKKETLLYESILFPEHLYAFFDAFESSLVDFS